jgi:hypothetical protein
MHLNTDTQQGRSYIEKLQLNYTYHRYKPLVWLSPQYKRTQLHSSYNLEPPLQRNFQHSTLLGSKFLLGIQNPQDISFLDWRLHHSKYHPGTLQVLMSPPHNNILSGKHRNGSSSMDYKFLQNIGLVLR